jgi:hypothetical protein
VRVLGQDRLLDEHRRERLELAQEALGHRDRGAAVEVDREVALGPERGPHPRTRRTR